MYKLCFFTAYNGKTLKQCLPNLHSLGEIYLPYFFPYISTLLILAYLYVSNHYKCLYYIYYFIRVVFLISYTLAGSQSFAELCQVS